MEGVMKQVETMGLVLLLVAAASATSFARAPMLVGGPCTYDEFPGTCTAMSVDAEGKAHFTFTGTVRGKKLVLKDNKTSEPLAVGASIDCTLKFITSGTCTPCLLSIGECGREGFEALSTR
jgi:hypothetical protein